VREADEAGAVALPAVEIDLRALVPSGRIRRDRRRFAAIFILCLVAHLAALVPLPFVGKDMPALEETIPIEILVEPPPAEAEQEPEKQPEEQAKEIEQQPAPVQQTFDEKPATDAARSAESDAKAPELKQEPPQEPPQEQKQDAPQASELAPEEPVYADVPLPPRIPQARQGLSSLDMEPLPDFKFEAPAKRMPFPGGNAEPTYLSMLYGMIMKHMFTQQIDPPKEMLRGRIAFAIGRDGRVFQEGIVKSSGMPELDRAALTAVRRAGPFPLPPGGGPIYLTFDYQSK
jgi:protein TonB